MMSIYRFSSFFDEIYWMVQWNPRNSEVHVFSNFVHFHKSNAHENCRKMTIIEKWIFLQRSIVLVEIRIVLCSSSKKVCSLHISTRSIDWRNKNWFSCFSRFYVRSLYVTFSQKMMKLEGRILLCHLIDRVEIWRKSIYTHHWIDYWKKFTKFWNIATVSSLVAILKMFISLLLFEINDEYI